MTQPTQAQTRQRWELISQLELLFADVGIVDLQVAVSTAMASHPKMDPETLEKFGNRIVQTAWELQRLEL